MIDPPLAGQIQSNSYIQVAVRSACSQWRQTKNLSKNRPTLWPMDQLLERVYGSTQPRPLVYIRSHPPILMPFKRMIQVESALVFSGTAIALQGYGHIRPGTSGQIHVQQGTGMNRRLLTILMISFAVAGMCSFVVYRLVGNRVTSAHKVSTTRIVAAAADIKVGTV